MSEHDCQEVVKVVRDAPGKPAEALDSHSVADLFLELTVHVTSSPIEATASIRPLASHTKALDQLMRRREPSATTISLSHSGVISSFAIAER